MSDGAVNMSPRRRNADGLQIRYAETEGGSGETVLLSPRAMGGFLLRLIDEWELGHPHVVGPDVGTGAVLFAAAEDVDRFPSAVVGSGGSSFPLEVAGALKQIIDAPDLSGFQAIDGRDVVAG